MSTVFPVFLPGSEQQQLPDGGDEAGIYRQRHPGVCAQGFGPAEAGLGERGGGRLGLSPHQHILA